MVMKFWILIFRNVQINRAWCQMNIKCIVDNIWDIERHRACTAATHVTICVVIQVLDGIICLCMSWLFIRIRYNTEFCCISKDVIRRFCGIITCLFKFKVKRSTLYMMLNIRCFLEPFIGIKIVTHQIHSSVVTFAGLIASWRNGFSVFRNNDWCLDILPVGGEWLAIRPISGHRKCYGLLAAIRFNLNHMVIVIVPVFRRCIKQKIVIAGIDIALILFGGKF